MILIEKDIMVVTVMNVLDRDTSKPPHAPSPFCTALFVINVDYLTVR
jgi:hypothetical protein